MTPWFIVLSCHRQAHIRSFSPFLSFYCGRGVIADAIMAASSAKSLQGLIQIN